MVHCDIDYDRTYSFTLRSGSVKNFAEPPNKLLLVTANGTIIYATLIEASEDVFRQ